MGGRIAFRGFWGNGELFGIVGPVMRELVIEAIRCRGEADTLKSSPLLLLTAIEVIGVTRLLSGVDELRLLSDVGVLIPEGGREGAWCNGGKVHWVGHVISLCVPVSKGEKGWGRVREDRKRWDKSDVSDSDSVKMRERIVSCVRVRMCLSEWVSGWGEWRKKSADLWKGKGEEILSGNYRCGKVANRCRCALQVSQAGVERCLTGVGG